jgi:hypothetical protein
MEHREGAARRGEQCLKDSASTCDHILLVDAGAGIN